MNKLIIGILLVSASYSHAFSPPPWELEVHEGNPSRGSRATRGIHCSASYGSSSDNSFIKLANRVGEGQAAGDEFYTLAVKNGRAIVLETQSGKQVPLEFREMSPYYIDSRESIQTSGRLDLAEGGSKYILVNCK